LWRISGSKSTTLQFTFYRDFQTREKAYDIVFTHHILVCLFNKKDDPLIGLRQMVMMTMMTRMTMRMMRMMMITLHLM
jgi:hypothetical protein